jgi:hypothetical protein
MTTKTLSKESLELRQPVQAKKPRIVKMSPYSSEHGNSKRDQLNGNNTDFTL